MEDEADAVHNRWHHPHAPAAMAALQVVCTWCQQPIVWHRVPTPLPFPISYSICTRCYGDVARELAPRRAGVALRTRT